MRKLEEGYFRVPKLGIGCFGASVINWLKLHQQPIDEDAMYKIYEKSPYTNFTEGTDLPLSVRQVEYITEGNYSGCLYHCVVDLNVNLDSHLLNFDEEKRQHFKDFIQEDIQQGKIIYSLKEVKQRIRKPKSLGDAVFLINPLCSHDYYKEGHAAVRLNPKCYPDNSYIDSDGAVYQCEPNEKIQIIGVLDFIKIY